MRPDGYLYPPPEKVPGKIVACVVEKKGDETRTSMRQSEIYAYSPSIIIRDGYMVMPKYHWRAFTPGDWFHTIPVYTVDRHDNVGVERELTEIKKIPPGEYTEKKIPPTKFEKGQVKIKCPFQFCPDFIRNREMRNSYGSFRKLYILNIGQGFVRNNKQEFNFPRDKVYYGIFEFRAKDNDAVNFAPRSEVRDHTNHVLERDAMWELTRILNDKVPVEVEKEMQQALGHLHAAAMKYDEELEVILNRGPSSLLDDSIADTTIGNDVSSKIRNMTIGAQTSIQQHSEESSQDESTITEDQDVLVFYTKEQLEAHRAKTIVLNTYLENGIKVDKWWDKETGDTCADNDYLNYKFDTRHFITERPEGVTVSEEPAAQIATESAPLESAPLERVEQPETHSPTRNRTMSENSVRLNSLGYPLASSTPVPSPESQRRNATFDPAYEEENNDDYESAEEEETTMPVNQTTDTIMLCRDNNANPCRLRR